MFVCLLEKNPHLAEKTKRFDYENSLRPCSDSNPDPCIYFTLHCANRLLYHCAILSVGRMDWPYWLLNGGTSIHSLPWVTCERGEGDFSVKDLGGSDLASRTADALQMDVTNLPRYYAF